MSTSDIPNPGDAFKHYKGHVYQVICVGKMELSGNPFVVYGTGGINSDDIWIRPLDGPKGWRTPHDQEVIGNIATKTRFTKI